MATGCCVMDSDIKQNNSKPAIFEIESCRSSRNNISSSSNSGTVKWLKLFRLPLNFQAQTSSLQKSWIFFFTLGYIRCNQMLMMMMMWDRETIRLDLFHHQTKRNKKWYTNIKWASSYCLCNASILFTLKLKVSLSKMKL